MIFYFNGGVMGQNEAIRFIDELLDGKLYPHPNYLFFAYFFKKLFADLVVEASNYQVEGKTKMDRLLSEASGLIRSIASKSADMIIRFDNSEDNNTRNSGEHIFAEVFLGRCKDMVNGRKMLNYKYLQHIFNKLSQVNEITKEKRLVLVDIANKLEQAERVLKKYK